MAQITAVDWLFTTLDNILELYPSEWSKVSKAVEEAKAMEKEQMIDADLNATIRTAKGANADVSVRRVKELAEQYYNETYNK